MLLVDNELKLRDTLAEVFASLGHQVTSVTFGAEAATALERQEFDVIALDLRLPDLEGKALWEKIRATRPGLASRVVFMSGGVAKIRKHAITQELCDDAAETFDFA